MIALADKGSGERTGDPYTYDAYGNMGEGQTNGQPFRYTGRRWDQETGLYYYRARYYSAELGRFLQTDPIGYEDNMNMYGYTANDSVNNTDPSGERDVDLGAFMQKTSARYRTARCFQRGLTADVSGKGTHRTSLPTKAAQVVAKNSVRLVAVMVAGAAGAGEAISGAIVTGGTAGAAGTATEGGDAPQIAAAAVLGAMSAGKLQALAGNRAAQAISAITDGVVAGVTVDAIDDGSVDVPGAITDAVTSSAADLATDSAKKALDDLERKNEDG